MVYLSKDTSDIQQETEELNSGDDLIAISLQAISATEGTKTIRFRGFLAAHQAYMLVDSGSSQCYITTRITGWKTLEHPLQVRVAKGSLLYCSH